MIQVSVNGSDNNCIILIQWIDIVNQIVRNIKQSHLSINFTGWNLGCSTLVNKTFITTSATAHPLSITIAFFLWQSKQLAAQPKRQFKQKTSLRSITRWNIFASHLSLRRYMTAIRGMTNTVLHCIPHGQFQWYFSKHQIEILYRTTGQESTKSISLDALASLVTKRYPSKTCTKGTRCTHPKRDLRVV